MKSRFLYVGIGGIVGLALMLAGWQILGRAYTYQGSLIDPPAKAADIQLTDQYGNPFRLSDQKRKVVMIFFGYTNCTDVCPTTLSHFKQIRAQLGSQAQDVEFLFITVDPARDTVQRMKDYLANYDPAFIGLTGTQAELESVWKNYGVYVSIPDNASASGTGYEVNHTTRIYAIDKQGNWRLTYPYEMNVNALLDDIRHLISG
jgi:protein SCO1/2